jgi:hypothetical protein
MAEATVPMVDPNVPFIDTFLAAHVRRQIRLDPPHCFSLSQTGCAASVGPLESTKGNQ